MSSKSSSWTQEEDQIFINTMSNLILSKGLTLGKSLETISEKLGRTVNGCQFRYSYKLKNNLSPEVLDKISANRPIKKLKDIKNDNDSVVNDETAKKIIDSQFDNSDSIHVDLDPQDFAEIPLLVVELKGIEERRSYIKGKLKGYNDYISNLIRNA